MYVFLNICEETRAEEETSALGSVSREICLGGL